MTMQMGGSIEVGDRVMLAGLMNDTILNGQIGNVRERKQVEGVDKFVVFLDIGRLVAVPVHAVGKTTGAQMLQMVWDKKQETAFFQQWALQIAREDASGFLQHAGRKHNGVYDYLLHKLGAVLNNKKKLGYIGQQCRGAKDQDIYLCACWSDGGPNQKTPFNGQPVAGEQWWPMIAINIIGFGPFMGSYCPALAWQDARPWEVHSSRLCWVDRYTPTFDFSGLGGLGPAPPPPPGRFQTVPPPPPLLRTPPPFIPFSGTAHYTSEPTRRTTSDDSSSKTGGTRTEAPSTYVANTMSDAEARFNVQLHNVQLLLGATDYTSEPTRRTTSDDSSSQTGGTRTGAPSTYVANTMSYAEGFILGATDAPWLPSHGTTGAGCLYVDTPGPVIYEVED